MGKKKSEEENTGAALALASNDALADLGDDFAEFADDGLGEADGDDFKIGARVFNFPGTDGEGEPIPKNRYFDTVDETTSKSFDAVLLTLHKTNDFSFYDNATQSTVRVCSSYDRVTGTVKETGEERPCGGCPHAKWGKDDDGKPTRDCGDVYNVAGVDLGNQMPFMIRFKKTSLKPFKTYLQKHHLGRRMAKGKRTNYPLFVFSCNLSLKMHESGNYALPVLQRGDVLNREQVEEYSRAAVAFRENMSKLMATTETTDTEGAPSSESGDFVDSPSDSPSESDDFAA